MRTELAQQRIERALALCRDNGWKSLLVYGNAWRCDYLRYVSDFPILEGHGLALLDDDGTVTLLLDTALEAERAMTEAPGCTVVHARDIFAEAERLIGRRNTATGMAPFATRPHGLKLAGGNIQAADAAFEDLLTRKTPGEIEAVRRAAALADEGYAVFRDAVRPGRAEYEIVADVEAFFRSRGCPDNFMIIGSGGTECMGMHPPGERRLQAGDLVTTELTPCVDGYYAQICRTLVIGEPSPTQLDAFDVYRRSMEAGIAAVRPGVTAGEIARIENDVFRAEGLGEYTSSKYTRVRGHGLGIYLDTKPAILEEIDMPLARDMTIIVHPNTYHPAAGYIVLGDSLVIRDDGAECLASTPRTLFSVPA